MDIQQFAEWGFSTFIANPFLAFGAGIMIISQILKGIIKFAPGKAGIIPLVLSIALAIILFIGGMFTWYESLYNGMLYIIVAFGGYSILHKCKYTKWFFQSSYIIHGGEEKRKRK